MRQGPEIQFVPAPSPRLLRSITIRNLLSFGPDTPPLELRALNVLIGPNGSGKSNLLSALSLLPHMQGDLNEAFKFGNSTLREWLRRDDTERTAEIEVAIEPSREGYLVHALRFTEDDWQLRIREESVQEFADDPLFTPTNAAAIYNASYGRGGASLQIHGREADLSRISDSRSALAQLRDPRTYPEFARLVTAYEGITLFRNWTFGGDSPLRQPQRGDLPGNFLREGGANLALVLNQLRRDFEAKDRIVAMLNELYDDIKDYETFTQVAYVELALREGKNLIPAPRLSDGTLRFLSLLAILCHPNPPPLICIEEPELGLHPDAVVAIGQLLKEASKRTQLIVTTHSRVLIDTLSESPEDVVVCAKRNGVTQMERLDGQMMQVWLEKYSLGELWSSGEIGGNRWGNGD